jgi:hypothetical protein
MIVKMQLIRAVKDFDQNQIVKEFFGRFIKMNNKFSYDPFLYAEYLPISLSL